MHNHNEYLTQTACGQRLNSRWFERILASTALSQNRRSELTDRLRRWTGFESQSNLQTFICAA